MNFHKQKRLIIIVTPTLSWLLLINSNIVSGFGHANGFGEQSLSKIAIHKALVSLHSAASVTSTPILGTKMTVTWTSGYDINEATPFVEWGPEGKTPVQSPAGTLTFSRNSMCGSPARIVGWRDPDFIHTSFLKNLWPNLVYTYRLGHLLSNGSYIWSKKYSFKSSPYPGQDSLQRRKNTKASYKIKL
ncbi:probable inactive purple acid phosphatase 27 [Trifolium pratense]|uniref:probable inactive purple acid phosphatase 27 n=1 Tax=Trifolium pratense TaxID=57577 RepID=UPI001E6961B8|nr:probable inactive purple acid phosphatase 27 [Trifolium pratense]